MGEEIIFYPRLLVRHIYKELQNWDDVIRNIEKSKSCNADIEKLKEKIFGLHELIEDASKFHGYLECDEAQIDKKRGHNRSQLNAREESNLDLTRYHGLSKEQLDIIDRETSSDWIGNKLKLACKELSHRYNDGGVNNGLVPKRAPPWGLFS